MRVAAPDNFTLATEGTTVRAAVTRL